MKVKDLLAVLQNLDGDADIIMSKDSEGNTFSPLSGFGFGVYRPTTTWYGEFISDEWTAEEACMEEEEFEALLNDNPISIVLWPMN